jgi:recombinational DNA repair protein RecR
MYGPNLTEFGAVSVRRLAWAIGTNMAEAIDFMALHLPQKMDMVFVCSKCKDKSKCGVCSFNPLVIGNQKAALPAV